MEILFSLKSHTINLIYDNQKQPTFIVGCFWCTSNFEKLVLILFKIQSIKHIEKFSLTTFRPYSN